MLTFVSFLCRIVTRVFLFYYLNMNVILIGSGGREHAIARCLAQSPLVQKIVVVPGNGGTAVEPKCKNVDKAACEYIEDNGVPACVQIAQHEKCIMAIVGPENPLAEGLADDFWKADIPCIGPKKAAAELEASKDFAKRFMHTYGIACAQSETFDDSEQAKTYAERHGAPLVIKADGLAAGKGVIVAATVEEALSAIGAIMDSGSVGEAGKKIVIEDYLEGVEISVLAAVSVTPEAAKKQTAAIVPFLPARDHKRLLDGAKGPNTGGMGAVCPLADVTDKTMEKFRRDILLPTLTGLVAEDFDYRGFIFFGVMLTKDGPKLLEYNVRLGDPETQAVLPLVDFDFAAMCCSIVNCSLDNFAFKWKTGCVVAPVIVSGGYPCAYEKGKEITIDERRVQAAGAQLFIAGAKRTADGKLVTDGGRVLACSAHGANFDDARKKAYEAIGAVRFDNAFYRNDIGLPGAAESKKL